MKSIYIKLKSRLSVCLHFWYTDISAVSTRIETGLARNESCVFEDHKVYLQAYSTYRSLTGVPRRPRCKQSLTRKATG